MPNNVLTINVQGSAAGPPKPGPQQGANTPNQAQGATPAANPTAANTPPVDDCCCCKETLAVLNRIATAVDSIAAGQASNQQNPKNPNTQQPTKKDYENLTMAIRSIRGVVSGAGTAAEQFARNQYGAAFGTVVETFAEQLEKAGNEGKAIAGMLRLATSSVTAFTAVTNAFVERGKELAGYSGKLAAAEARASIAETFADIREAEKLGPALAELTDRQTQIWVQMREFFLPMKEALINSFSAILGVFVSDDKSTNRIQDAAAAVRDMRDSLNRMPDLDWMQNFADRVPDRIGEAIARAINGGQDLGDSEFLQDFFAAGGDAIRRGGNRIPPGPQGVPPLGVPAIISR